uniref:Uncharacterized protein n=1 Tax=Anguilla anguilla TaxID=7936 RepID=A0A0E9VLG4_ANGAN
MASAGNNGSVGKWEW